MLYLLYKIGRFLSLVLPWRVSYWLAELAGSIYYILARKDRNIVINNLRVVLAQVGRLPQIYYASRMVFVNFARYLVEFFCTDRIDTKYIEKYIKIVGRENLESAQKLKKGVLVVSAHLGNWEWGAMVLSMLGYKTNVIAWTHKHRRINELFLRTRQNKGLQVIPLGMEIRKAFSALKNNELVALLGDIDYTHPQLGLKVNFFGQETVFPKGPAVLSLRTGAPIVPGFLVRERAHRYRLLLEKPLVPEKENFAEADLVCLTQDLAKAMEFYISLYPEQWFMLTPRWQL